MCVKTQVCDHHFSRIFKKKIAAFSLTYYLKKTFINRTQGKPKKLMKNGTQAFLIIRSAYKI